MTKKEKLEYIISCVDRCFEDETYSKEIFAEMYEYLDKLYKPVDEEKLDEMVEYVLDDAYMEEDMKLERKAAEYGCKLGYQYAFK